MSDEIRKELPQDQEQESRGVNLTLIYTLIVLAMLAAIVVAALVVLPYYHRR
jgi:hypothetical protein